VSKYSQSTFFAAQTCVYSCTHAFRKLHTLCRTAHFV